MTVLTLVLPSIPAPSPTDSQGAARVANDPVATLRKAGLSLPPGTLIHVDVERSERSDICTTDDLLHTVGG